MNRQRRMIHADINSYFATLLQQENPKLRGRPVAVVKSTGRTCVIAASKEAKKLGVRTGDAIGDAKKLAPGIIAVPAQFELYLSATKKLKHVFDSLSPEVNIFSLDEAFLDMSNCERIAPDLHQFGLIIQKKVAEYLGSWVTCNVGIGPNKFLAKMASERAPKGSVTEINEVNLDEALLTTPFADVCGVGIRLERKLHRLGIDNLWAINLLDEQTLLTHFGPFWTKELRKMARGEEPHLFSHIRTTPHMKSVGRTITGYALTTNPAAIQATLHNLMEEATYKLRKMELMGRRIGISLWGDQGAYWQVFLTLHYWVQHTSEIFPFLFDRYREAQVHFPVIKFGVFISQLKPAHQLTQSWLPETKRQERLSLAMDTANDKYGRFTIRSGRLLGNELIHPEVTGFLGDKSYYQLD